MKVFKKNQVIISVIALMLITVGYMNYTSNVKNTIATGVLMDAEKMAGLGDAKLVNSSVVEQVEESNDIQSEQNISKLEEGNDGTQIKENNVDDSKEVLADINDSEYFASSKLERDKMYSQMIETYQKLLESSMISAEQKSISTQEIAKINNMKNSIMIAENLIKNLGFENVVIFVNDESISVIVKAQNLEQADVAQIQNIVCREIGVEVEKIHISNK